MQLFKYQKEKNQTQIIKKEFLKSFNPTDIIYEEVYPTELSTGPNCLKR